MRKFGIFKIKDMNKPSLLKIFIKNWLLRIIVLIIFFYKDIKYYFYKFYNESIFYLYKENPRGFQFWIFFIFLFVITCIRYDYLSYKHMLKEYK